MLQNFIDILAAPKAAFARIKEKPSIWLPLLVFIAAQAAAQSGYFLLNDEAFVKGELIDQQIALLNANNAQSEQIEKAVMDTNLTTQAVISAISLAVILPIVTALMAWYLSFMGKFSFSQLTFRHWFSLQVWTSIPQVFASVAALIVLLTDANGQVSQANVQPLSFAALFGGSGYLLQQINLTHVWSLVLLALGYAQWTKKGLLTSFLITWAPTVIIVGGLALLLS